MYYRAVIFDMDGLLIESEKIARSIFVEACREYNFEPDIEVYNRVIGTTTNRTREILREGYGETFPLEAVWELWQTKYHHTVLHDPVPIKPGALELLEYLDNAGIRKAVVTSTAYELAKTKLTNAGLIHYFEFVMDRDQVVHGKPNPEIYLAACEILGVDPADCLALEDSNNGVLAAYHAGLTVFQIPDLVVPSAEVTKLGHRILGSLREVQDIIQRQQ